VAPAGCAAADTAAPLAPLRAWWKTSAILTSGVAADIITSLLDPSSSTPAPRPRRSGPGSPPWLT